MTKQLKFTLIVFALTFGMSLVANADEKKADEKNADEKQRPNILFVSVDDLRPEIGCYGNEEIKTPCFDAFAKTGTTFLKAYCQAAVCAPSRAS